MSTTLRRGVSPRLEADERQSYGTTSHSTESALFAGYRSVADQDPHVDQRPCVCGGIVIADPDAPARGVAQHNTTGRHRAWQANQEGWA